LAKYTASWNDSSEWQLFNVFMPYRNHKADNMDETENLLASQSRNTSSICSQKPATETYSEPDESSLYLHIQQILLIRPSDLHLDTEGMLY